MILVRISGFPTIDAKSRRNVCFHSVGQYQTLEPVQDCTIALRTFGSLHKLAPDSLYTSLETTETEVSDRVNPQTM